MEELHPDDASRIIRRPYVTEKTFDMVERENRLVFIVDDDAGKEGVKQAIQTLYKVNVESVNICRTIRGKKAYVRLSPESSASDLASRLGLV